VCTYDAVKGKSWFAAVAETAVESHFYSGELNDGTKDTLIETHLAEIESKAAPVYERLLRGDIPDQSQGRMDFAHFLGLMFSRTRAMRRMAAETRGRTHQGLMDMAAFPFLRYLTRLQWAMSRTSIHPCCALKHFP
jgi:hypothetical protein